MRLLLLLLPLGLFADVNLVCGNLKYQIKPSDTPRKLDGEFVVSINEEARKVIVENIGDMGYEEKGTKITFRSARELANKNLLTIYTLNRISGVLLEQNWSSIADYEDMDVVERLDTEGHIRSYTVESKCNKAELLF